VVAHFTIARALALDGRTDEAIEHFRETIRLDPKFAYAVSNLGMVLAAKGALAEALDLVKQAVALDDQSAGNYDRLAEVLRGQGRFLEAIDALQRAVSLDPGFLIYYFRELSRGTQVFTSPEPGFARNGIRRTNGTVDCSHRFHCRP